jgi:hypothetical protein
MAKKVIRLTEQDLVSILKNILSGKSLNLKDGNMFSNLFSGLKDENIVSNLLSGLKDTDPSDKDSDSIKNISLKGQQLLNNPIFKEKLKEISNEIGISENSILKLMKHESGLDSSVKNSIGCVGLIQFCPDRRGGSSKTINGKTYSLNELQNNLELQLEAIKEFWSKGKRDGKIKNAKDLYVYNFFPVAAGKSDDYVLQAKGLSAQKVARANPVFNRTLGRPVNTPLTVGDLTDYYQKTGMV